MIEEFGYGYQPFRLECTFAALDNVPLPHQNRFIRTEPKERNGRTPHFMGYRHRVALGDRPGGTGEAGEVPWQSPLNVAQTATA